MPATRLPEPVIERLMSYADAESLRTVRIRTTAPWSWLPRVLRVGAVTLGRDVCFRPDVFRLTDRRGLALVAHECIHVRQYRELGAPRFLARYLLGAVRTRFVHDLHPMELEPEAIQARARQELEEFYV